MAVGLAAESELPLNAYLLPNVLILVQAFCFIHCSLTIFAVNLDSTCWFVRWGVFLLFVWVLSLLGFGKKEGKLKGEMILIT